MTIEEFKESLKSPQPSTDNKLLQAMWFDGKGDWESAHNIAQEIETREGSIVHAYLHRKEGDESNARYWYARANAPFPKASLHEEWEMLVKKFLA